MPRNGAINTPCAGAKACRRTATIHPIGAPRTGAPVWCDAVPGGAEQNAAPMSLALVHSRALDGLDAPAVQVEVHLANGLPAFTLVGLADTEVKEARERVRAALATSGFAFPHNKRIRCSQEVSAKVEKGRLGLPAVAPGLGFSSSLLWKASRGEGPEGGMTCG
jgi:hypothetical protein